MRLQPQHNFTTHVETDTGIVLTYNGNDISHYETKNGTIYCLSKL